MTELYKTPSPVRGILPLSCSRVLVGAHPMLIPVHHGLRLVLLGLLVAPFVGCSRSDLHSVSGTVTLDGAPLSGAFIEFVPTSVGDSTISYGKTDPEGHYRMDFNNASQGVMVGEYRVKIRTSDIAQANDGRLSMTPEKVPDQYRGDRSELIRTVVEGKNVFDFPLTSDGRLTQPRLRDL